MDPNDAVCRCGFNFIDKSGLDAIVTLYRDRQGTGVKADLLIECPECGRIPEFEAEVRAR